MVTSDNNSDIIRNTEANRIKDGDELKISLKFGLNAFDIFCLILRIHWILLFLPFIFLSGYLAVLISGRYVGWELYVYFTLFCLSIVLILYVYIGQFLVFKRLLFFTNKHTEYTADFNAFGVKIAKGDGSHATEYQFSDFIKGRECKKVIYLYFKYDRALIIKKKLLRGSEAELRTLLVDSLRFRPLRSRR